MAQGVNIESLSTYFDFVRVTPTSHVRNLSLAGSFSVAVRFAHKKQLVEIRLHLGYLFKTRSKCQSLTEQGMHQLPRLSVVAWVHFKDY